MAWVDIRRTTNHKREGTQLPWYGPGLQHRRKGKDRNGQVRVGNHRRFPGTDNGNSNNTLGKQLVRSEVRSTKSGEGAGENIPPCGGKNVIFIQTSEAGHPNSDSVSHDESKNTGRGRLEKSRACPQISEKNTVS